MFRPPLPRHPRRKLEPDIAAIILEPTSAHYGQLPLDTPNYPNPIHPRNQIIHPLSSIEEPMFVNSDIDGSDR
ncbi:MAG: hypothetical protein IIA92_11235 [Chloroflexi bacterium]|nr:hypothetical protein [Chloroflexota bacterium]